MPADDGRKLAVALGDGHAGDITRSRRGATYGFAYSADWLASPSATALSVSLPLRPKPFLHEECSPFFAGLLPEGAARQATARRLGVSVQNDVALLEALGGDCAGAVSIGPALERPPTDHRAVGETTVQWLGAVRRRCRVQPGVPSADPRARGAGAGSCPSRKRRPRGQRLGRSAARAGRRDRRCALAVRGRRTLGVAAHRLDI